MQDTVSVGQPTAFHCIYPLPTSGKVDATWYKYPRKIPVSKNIQSRIHQDQNWIFFLPVKGEDSGIDPGLSGSLAYWYCVSGRSCHSVQIQSASLS